MLLAGKPGVALFCLFRYCDLGVRGNKGHRILNPGLMW